MNINLRSCIQIICGKVLDSKFHTSLMWYRHFSNKIAKHDLFSSNTSKAEFLFYIPLKVKLWLWNIKKVISEATVDQHFIQMFKNDILRYWNFERLFVDNEYSCQPNGWTDAQTLIYFNGRVDMPKKICH